MLTLKKYLRDGRPDEDGRLPVEIRICWRGRKVRFQPGVRVHPDHWHEGGFQREKTPALRANMRRLNMFTDCLEDYFDACVLVPTEGEVRAEIERIRCEELGEAPKGGSAASVSTTPPGWRAPGWRAPGWRAPVVPLKDFFDVYIRDQRAVVSGSTLDIAKAVKNHLVAWRKNVDWSDLTLSGLNGFRAHLGVEKGLSDNTLATYLGVLKSVLAYADQNEIPLPRGLQHFKVSKADSLRPSLSRADLTVLENAQPETFDLNWRHKPVDHWKRFRDLVVLHCYTGLRHVDLHQLTLSRVKHIDGTPCLVYVQQKTGTRVTLPLVGPAYRILQRTPACGEGVPNLKEYNRDFQTLAELAGLDRPVVVGTSRRGKMEDRTEPLHKHCTSHICRHTFATLMLAGGMNPAVLQVLMGHASLDSTMRYPEISSGSIISQTLDAWRLGSAA